MAREAMTVRSLRVSQRLWHQALTAADERDEVLSEVVRAALQTYVNTHASHTQTDTPSTGEHTT